MNAGYTEYLALNLDVIRDVFYVSCYPLVSASKQVFGELASAISNGPAYWKNAFRHVGEQRSSSRD